MRVNLAWTAAGALAGLPIGTLLRGPVCRLSVPSGDPYRTACPRCQAPLRSWSAARCGECRRFLGPPLVFEVAVAAVLALLLGRFGGQPVTLAFAFLGVVGVALAAIDVAVRRLPDRLTLPAYPVLIVLLAFAAVAGHEAGALVRALLGGLSLAAVFLVLALIRPGQLGGGDIKLAGLAGLALGWIGWQTLISGTMFGFALCAIYCLVLLAARRITLSSDVYFGPFLLGGAILALIAAG